MTDLYVQVSPDSTGKLVDTAQLTVNALTVQRQRVAIGDNTTPANYLIIDANGNAQHKMAPAPASLLTSAAINFSASGLNAIVAAVAAKTTKIHRIFFKVNGATTITFQDGSTALTGPIQMLSNDSIILDFSGDPWFTGSTNTAFNLNSTNAVQVSGTVWYVQS
jgi:hypothetical protein